MFAVLLESKVLSHSLGSVGDDGASRDFHRGSNVVSGAPGSSVAFCRVPKASAHLGPWEGEMENKPNTREILDF